MNATAVVCSDADSALANEHKCAGAAKIHYNTILANVDWLHGTAESFLTITNLLIGAFTVLRL